tara:strand:- start:8306 stop:9454 length:1149 start_codon:yes stop_codon:yes gene_type:complete
MDRKRLMKLPEVIRLSKSCIGKSEKQSVLNVLDNEYLGMGSEVDLFEQKLSNFFKRDSVCVVNGTAALHLSIQACNITHGDEVLVPSLTYISSFQAISATGAKPVPCDISETDFLIDINEIKRKITNKTKAIMLVHYSGGVGDLSSYYSIAKKYNLRVIEDAAHAFGSIYKGNKVGSFGDIACFSFDGIKNITSGEGGCIVTDDKKVLNRIRDLRLLGVEKDSDKRYQGKRSWDFDVKYQGWRYHMSNIMAAIGLVQLEKFNFFAKKRKELAQYYDKKFLNIEKISSISRDYNSVVPHIYVVRIKGLRDRKKIQKEMLKKGIQTGYHYYPNHFLSFYKSKKINLPITEKIYKELVTLPLHPDLEKVHIDYICKELINTLEKF